MQYGEDSGDLKGHYQAVTKEGSTWSTQPSSQGGEGVAGPLRMGTLTRASLKHL